MTPVHKKERRRRSLRVTAQSVYLVVWEKMLERIICSRLIWHLEEKRLLVPEQAAFIQNRSTEHQITYISQAIEDALQEKKQTLVVWI